MRNVFTQSALKRIILIVGCFLTADDIYPQSSFAIYSGVLSDFKVGSVTESETGFLYWGGTFWTGSGYHNVVSKMTASGEYVWVKEFGATGQNGVRRITLGESNSVYVGGYVDGSPWDFAITKLDSNGIVSWARKFAPLSVNECNAIDGLSGGGIVAVGYMQNDAKLPSVVKLNSAGDVVWSKYIGASESTVLYNVKEVENKNIVVVGQGHGSTRTFISKLDSNGVVQWSKWVTFDFTSVCWGIDIDSEGNYLAAGYIHSSPSKIFVVKLSNTGTLLAAKSINASSSLQSFSIAINESDEMFFSGQSSGLPLVAKMSSSFVLDFAKIFSLGSSGEVYEARPAQNGGFYAGGTLNISGNTHGLLLHGDSNGSVSCTEINLSASVQDIVSVTSLSSPEFSTSDFGSSSLFTWDFHNFTTTWSSYCSLLPVELTSFSAEQSGNSVILRWVTASEVNNYGFMIQRAEQTSGITPLWKDIAFMPGAGNSNSEKVYQFIDNISKGDNLLYRLCQINNDGTMEYSKIIEVHRPEIPGSIELANFPNPFNGSTRIRYSIPESSKIKLKLFDMQGTELTTLVDEYLEKGTFYRDFDASKLSSGLYFCRLYFRDRVITSKFMLLK